MTGKISLALVVVVLVEMTARAEYPIVGCEFGKARVTEGFWFDRLETNRTATLPADATFVDETLTIGDKTFPALRASNGLRLIPYCLWGNREPGNELQCWFRER